ncbi:MAG: efflux RND transporter permease subunit [bacterium]
MISGFAGKIAKTYLNSKLTPLLVIVSLLLGIFSVFMMPREEEPQIKVPMIDVYIPIPGYTPKEVENRVTNPVERQLSGLFGIKHVYSTSIEGASFITARFKVGEDLEASLIKVYHKIDSMKYSLPNEAMPPVVKSYTIDDVPFYTITFYSKEYSSYEIRSRIVPIAKDLQAINGVSDMNIIGGERTVARITPNLAKLKEFGITLIEMKQAVERSSSQFIISPIYERSPEPLIAAGAFVSSLKDIKSIPLGRRFGKTIKLGDTAKIEYSPDEKNSYVLYGTDNNEAVTVVFTKKKLVNATVLAEKLEQTLKVLSRNELDKNIKWEITRDYGATAKEKSNELIKHLLIATFSVMILIAFMLGLRVSLVVGIAVPVTLAITLLVYYLMGYTLNRVTLFALIFSIGILVDDAIVVVENIYRHLALGFHKARDIAISAATDEVGNPTILATAAVIVAIMPMAFVGGLMGPYMRPIPIGASLAMVFSLFIAFIVSPWASKRLIKDTVHEKDPKKKLLGRIFSNSLGWMLDKRRNTVIIMSLVALLLLGSILLVAGKQVKVKMLPFDNKSEFQILVDLPPGSTLDETKEFANQIAEKLHEYEEVENIQQYIGTAAPFSFSGMVKHTFLRKSSYKADLQVNLKDKHKRKMQSHDIVKKIRTDIVNRFQTDGIKLKFLEIPPGPPVLSTVLAELYHPDEKKQYELLNQVKDIYLNTDGIVEVDTTLEPKQSKLYFKFNRQKGEIHGVPQNFATNTLMMALGKLDLFPVHLPSEQEPVFMRMSLSKKDKTMDMSLLNLLVPSLEGDKISLNTVMDIEERYTLNPIHHKDLQRVMYVMGEVTGAEESPVYAIAKMNNELKNFNILYSKQPQIIDRPILKWDGEMAITVEVFRDLGIAFFIAIVLILILVTGWYNSFVIPFIIIIPVPLSLIGIIPGHLLFDAFFTATSMIGFIAGAGITVRNSIILIDFIEHKRSEGCVCKEAVIDSVIVRFRPILLTALAVIVAATVILFDPIFQGLAISLMMGSIASALLSIPTVPVLYYWLQKDAPVKKGKNIDSINMYN